TTLTGTFLKGRNRIGRLNADGTVDEGFRPPEGDGVYALAVQPDGKILIGVDNVNHLERENPDDSHDFSFDPRPTSTVYAVAVQPDEKILLGGAFTMLGS